MFHVMVMRCDNGLIFACTILGMQISPNGNSQKVMQMLAKIRKSQATIYLLSTSAQIYRIANLKVPLLYMVALSELKLNENSEHDGGCNVPKYAACLNPFISGGIFSTHLSPIFCVKKLVKLREIPSVSFFRIKI